MGKGDIRSRRGKIWRGTYGVSRPAKRKNSAPRPAPARKVKALKDLPKVMEPIREEVPVALEVAETAAPVDVQHPSVEQAAEALVLQQETVESAQELPEAKAPDKKGAKKASVKKAAAKKPAAKKAPAKKKKKK